MKYLLLIYGNQEKWSSIPAAEWPEAIARQDAFNRKYQETGELIGAYGLADAAAARLVRRENGQPAVTDGPYLETKEYIASFYLLDCRERGSRACRSRRTCRGRTWSRSSSGRSCTRPSRSCDRRPGRRGPAAGAGAAGPRRAGAPLRAVPPVRGRQPGGTARGGRAVAGRRDTAEPARLAGHGRLAPADGPGPQ